jgi:hypothetical protein
MFADGKTIINTAESVSVTFPEYVQIMKQLGANLVYRNDQRQRDNNIEG